MPTRRLSAASSTEQALGRVEGALEGIQDTMKAMAEAIAADRREASAQRAETTETLAEMQTNIAALMADMSKVKPLTDRWQSWQYIGFGAFLVIGVMGSAAWAAMNFFQDIIFWLFGWGGK